MLRPWHMQERNWHMQERTCLYVFASPDERSLQQEYWSFRSSCLVRNYICLWPRSTHHTGIYLRVLGVLVVNMCQNNTRSRSNCHMFSSYFCIRSMASQFALRCTFRDEKDVGSICRLRQINVIYDIRISSEYSTLTFRHGVRKHENYTINSIANETTKHVSVLLFYWFLGGFSKPQHRTLAILLVMGLYYCT